MPRPGTFWGCRSGCSWDNFFCFILKKRETDQRRAIIRLPPRWRFLLPSVFGLSLFLLPVTVDGQSTIILGVITDLVKLPLQPWALEIIGGVICLSALGGLSHRLWGGADWEHSHPAFHAFCAVTPPSWRRSRSM